MKKDNIEYNFGAELAIFSLIVGGFVSTGTLMLFAQSLRELSFFLAGFLSTGVAMWLYLRITHFVEDLKK